MERTSYEHIRRGLYLIKGIPIKEVTYHEVRKNYVHCGAVLLVSVPSIHRSDRKCEGTGDGTTEVNPAGNLTYVLEHYELENVEIRVKPGNYGSAVESFPLQLEGSNVVLSSPPPI